MEARETPMKVGEFRDLCARVRDAGVAFHACVDAAERAQWQRHAERELAAGRAATCTRATELDRSRLSAALEDLQGLVAMAMPAPAIPIAAAVRLKGALASCSRAARYNRSPGRAVRLARAARSAMRRGYF